MRKISLASKFKIKFFISVLICLLAGMLVGIFAFRILSSLGPSPKKVIEKMIAEMEKVKTSEGKMEFSFSQSDGEQVDLSYTIQGKEDFTQKENRKSESIFKINYSLSGEESNFNFEYGGEKRVIGGEIYLKFTQLPEFEVLDFLSFLKDQWIKIDRESFSESIKKAGGEITPEAEKMYQERLEKLEEQEKLQSALEKILMEEGGFRVKKRLPDERVNQKDCYHYLVSLNKGKILKTISEMSKEESMLGIGTTSLEDLKTFFEKIKGLESEIWVGKDDFLLYKIKIERGGDLSKFGKKGKFKIKLSIENFNYNLPMKIEAPPEYKLIGEILAPLFGGYSEKMKTLERKTKDAQIIVEAIRAKTVAELMKTYENSFEGLCQNGTLNEKKRNYKLDEIEEEIKNLQGGVLDLSCLSSQESFCLSVNLVSSSKRYCLDSSGIAKEIDQNLNCLGRGTTKEPFRCPQK
jgi:hypothetical protein